MVIRRKKQELYLSRRERGEVSPYLQSIRDWQISHMVAGYISAYAAFQEAYKRAHPLSEFPFRDLEKLSNALFELKEDHHLIYKRVVGPDWVKKEDRHKLDPGEIEIRFIGNVGMLFHKFLAARELKYIHLHYDPLSDAGSDAAEQLILVLRQIRELFESGREMLLEFIRTHSTNVMLLAYLYAHSKVIKSGLGLSGIEILKQSTGCSNLEPIYFRISKYYVESGWYDRAQKLLRQIIRRNPKQQEARALLQQVKMSIVSMTPKSAAGNGRAV